LGFKGRGYKNTYANTALGTLKTMLNFAVEQELIKVNPCLKVRRLKNDKKDIKIFTGEEVKKLFPDNWKKVWMDKPISYAANRLASLTGMRIGEVMGLRGEYVFEKCIYVCGQYGEFGYGPTKTKETRFIPLIPEIIAMLNVFKAKNGNGYIFSEDGGATPSCRKTIYDDLHRALVRIGVSLAEIKNRGLHLHAWRHFLNTQLQMQGLTLSQVQSVTGHKSEKMTGIYSHLDARQLEDVMKAQYAITGINDKGKKPKTSKPQNRKPDNVIKMPKQTSKAEKGKSIARKMA
jgi:integrase